MEIRRRDFLKLFGGISGAVLLGGSGFNDVMELPEKLVEQARRGPGIETWQNTICGLCPGGCGMRVRLIDGIPVYVKGNSVYPVNRGGLCSLGLNALHSLYHPDRLKGPVKRKGNPGRSTWEPISWDEALEMIGDRLVELRGGGKAHQVAFLGHEERGLMRRHIARFMQAYGSPNYHQFSSAQNNGVPHSLLYGHRTIPAFDFLNAKLIVSFGANVLEEGYSPVYYTKLYSHHQERQTRYVQIESRLSLTAANADRWIPIRPGTYGALALGLAYVLIREEFSDREFIRSHTLGFEDWVDRSGVKHVGFKNMVLGNYYPERVAEITGIPSTTILDLGRELGNTRPALVVGDQGTIDNTNGTFAAMAVHSVNALLGNIQRDGGVFFVDDPPFAELPKVQMDSLSGAGDQLHPVGLSSDGAFPLTQFSIESFAGNIVSGTPYPVSVLFLYGGNPLFQALNHRELTQAFEKIPLVVSFDSVITETSEYAHLVLPEHHFMERWEEVSNTRSVGFTHVGMQHPIVSPLYDTRHPADVLIELSKRIGGPVAETFPMESYNEELAYTMKGIFRSGEGAIVSENVGSHWLEYLQQRGWQIDRYSSFEEFWDRLVEQGGWWNPIRESKPWPQVFRTPSGKFEFFSQTLKAALENLAVKTGERGSMRDWELVLNRLNISARGDMVFLPHHEPVPYDADMPLHLVQFRVLPVHDGQGAYLPMMQEMFGYAVRRHWQSWVEIHPETAETYHIQDGQWVWVESSVGRVKVQAKLLPGIMANVIAIPFGLGHTSYGRYAKNHGVNPNHTVMKNLYDLLTGKPALQGTKVTISPAT
jgi:anaerobic selenocysteine-containing dehydrogenase